jgi:hypothetical protein
MGAISVGSVTVQVVPVTTGIEKTLKAQLEGPAAAAGDAAGKTFGDAMAEGIGDPVEEALLKAAKDAQTPAATVGEELGKTIADPIKDQVGKAPADGLGEGAPKALPPAVDQGTRLGGAFADAFKDRLKAAFEALPKATIGADSAQADRQIEEIRGQLAELRSLRIGVDISDADALAKLAEIKAALEDVDHGGSIDLRVDTAAAIAQLGAVEAQVQALDAKTARPKIDIDTGNALAEIAHVGIALAALSAIPAVATIGLGVGGLAAGGIAAGAGLGAIAAAALPGLSAVKTALSDQAAASQAAESATQGLAGASGQAADQALQEAGAEQSLAQAKHQAAYSDAQAAQQVTAAEQSLAQAQTASLAAQKAITAARVQAAQDLQDLNNQLTDAALGQRQDQLALVQATADLQATMANPGATQLQREQAQLTYDQAVQQLTEQGEAYQRLQTQAAAANKAGIAGSTDVTTAQAAAAQAAQQVQSAEQQLAQARAAQVQAQLQGADQIASAQRQIAELELQSGAAGASGLSAQAQAALKAKQAYDALNPSQRVVYTAYQTLTTSFKAWASAMDPTVLPLIATGIGLVARAIPLLTPLVTGASGALDKLEGSADRAIGSPFWKGISSELGSSTGTALLGFGDALGHVATGVAGVVSSLLPYAPTILRYLDELTGKFSSWGQNLGNSSGFHEFIGYVSANGPQLGQTIHGIATAVETVVKDLAPMGGSVLTVDGALAKIVTLVASFSPGLVQWGVGAALAYKGLKPLAGGLTSVIGDSESGARGVIAAFKSGGDEGSKFGGVLVKMKGWAQAGGSGLSSGASGAWSKFNGLLSTGATKAEALGANLLTAGKNAASAAGSGLSAGASAVGNVAASAASAAVNLGKTGLAYAVTGIKAGASAIAIGASAVATGVATAATALWTAATSALDAVMDANPLILIGLAIAGLIAAVIYAYTHFQTFRDVVHDAWAVIGTVISGTWRDVIKPVFDAIKSVVLTDIPSAFKAGVGAVETAWDRINAITAAPANFMIKYVYDDGIAKLWNGVVGAVGLPGLKLPTLSQITVPQLAAGGVVPASPMVVNSPRAIVGEGDPRWPEYVIPTDPKYRGRAVALHAAAGAQLLASGGVLGALGSLGSWLGAAASKGATVASLISDPAAAWRSLTGAVLASSARIQDSPFGKLLAAVPSTLADKLGGVLVSAVTGLGSSGHAAALATAAQQLLPAKAHAYDAGGYLPPGVTLAYNGTGLPEPVLTSAQWDAFAAPAPGAGARTTTVYVYPPAADAATVGTEVMRRMAFAGLT